MKFQIMLNRSILGKKPATISWNSYNAHWMQYETEPRDMLKQIYLGYSVSAVFNGNRVKQNFVSAQHFGLDFDHNGLDDVFKIPFIAAFAAFGYETPSSTKDAPRCRVIFIYDEPVFELAFHEQIIASFMRLVKRDSEIICDASCKDGLRLFYGSPRCNVKVNPCEVSRKWFSSPYAILSLDMAEDIVDRMRELPPAEEKKSSQFFVGSGAGKSKLVRAIFSTHLRAVGNAAQGERNAELNKRVYVMAQYINADWVGDGNVTEGEIFDNFLVAAKKCGLSENEATATIKSAIKSGLSQPPHSAPAEFVTSLGVDEILD